MAHIDRQRDLFPLPVPFVASADTYKLGVSRSVRRRALRKCHWESWLADGVACLNEISGSTFDSVPAQPANLVQAQVSSRLRGA